MKKKRIFKMFAPILYNISKKLLFFGAFLMLCFTGYGQDLSIEDVTEDEDVGNMVFTVTLNGSTIFLGTSVTYSFIDVSATGGIDYDNTVGPALIFFGFNGETQTITVPITDDLIDENDNEDFTVQLGTPTNGVGLLGGGNATGIIVDNDVVGVNVTPVVGATSESGTSADFLFTLTSQPTADVTIPTNGYDATEHAGPTSVVLTSVNWNTGVTLTVTGIDDAIVDGDVSYNLNTGDVTSPDSFYDALVNADVPQINLTNLDDDVAGAIHFQRRHYRRLKTVRTALSQWY